MPKMIGDAFIENYLHPLFNAENDSQMFTQMLWISFFYTLSVIFSMALFPAPYGKPFFFIGSSEFYAYYRQVQ